MATLIGDLVRITPRMKFLLNDDVMNTFHFRVDKQDKPTDAEFMVEVALMMDVVYTFIEAYEDAAISAFIIEGKNITQNIILPATVFPTYIGGTAVGDSTAPQVGPMTYFPTTKPRTQGRVFWPPISEGFVANGVIAAAALSAHAAAGFEIRTGMDTATVELTQIIFNRVFGTFVIPVAGITKPEVRTQKRRRVGVGS